MAVDTVDQTEVKPSNTAKAVEAVGADFSLPGLRKQVLAKEKEYKDITGKKATEMQPVIEQVGKAVAPTAPTLLEQKEYKPTNIDPEKEKEAFSSFMAWSMIGGALTKQPLVAAMKNYTGAMQGWMEGDKQRLAKEASEFDRNFKVAQAKNTAKLEEYRVAQDKYKNDIQGLMNQLKLISMKYEDPIKASLAEKGDLQQFVRQVQADVTAQKRATDQMNLLVTRMSMQKEKEEKPQYFAGKTPDGKDAMYMVKDGKVELVTGSEGLGLSKPGSAGAGAPKIGSRERSAANNLVAASNEGAQVISDLAYLSAGDPLFANKLSDVDDKGSITGGVAGYMSRKLSTQQQQEYVKLIDGLTNVLTRVQSGTGYASDVTKGKMDALRKVILAKEGATNAVGYQSIAEANQIFIRGLESIETNAALNEEQKALIKRNIQEAAEGIPYTVRDAIDYGRANFKGTMQEFLDSTGRKGRQLERIRQETPTDPLKAVALPNEEIHIDAKGVRAVKRNNQWVEVQ